VIRGAVLTLAGLASGACGANAPSATHRDASVDVGSVDVASVAADAPALSGGPLVLMAWGGASGDVAAAVDLIEPGVGPQETCAAPLDAGACELTSCQMGGIGSPRQGYGNFGPLSATVGTTTVPLLYTGFGYPTVYFPTSVTLGGGGTMRFTGGDGAAIPLFDVSATIPGIAVITSPAPSAAGGAPSIDTSQDLSVTWSPISIGQVHFQLEGGSPTQGGVAVSVLCTFDGASGSGVVPQTLVSSLKQMAPSDPTYASISSELDATTVVDGFTIVTQSRQNSLDTERAFEVSLQ